jgi:hypothetical protein
MSQMSPNDTPDYATSNFEWDEVQTAWESHYYNCAACQKLESDGTLEEAISGFCAEGQQLASKVVNLDKVLSEDATDVTL